VGELIAIVLVLVVVVVLLAGGITFAVKVTRPDPNAVESPQYRNHLAMARWIEHILNDDMVRVTIPADRQGSARKLLDEFYKESS
jgi:hypothetical protein